MLRLLEEVSGYKLDAKDGSLGRVKDFLFDDEHWTIRYMVANTRHWLPGRQVLISPVSLKEADWLSRGFAVDLTQEQIKNAPGLEEDAPVSRQYERRWYETYGYPYYWGTADVWGGGGTYPEDLLQAAGIVPSERSEEGDPEEQERVLRSVKEVDGYHIQACDGEAGHVSGFIVDDETWTIRYLVVNTRSWLPGRHVLLAPGWTTAVHWAVREVETSLSRDAIQNSPEFDPAVPVNREYEQTLYDYYGRPVYWR
jgi:hypothetical protein